MITRNGLAKELCLNCQTVRLGSLIPSQEPGLGNRTGRSSLESQRHRWTTEQVRLLSRPQGRLFFDLGIKASRARPLRGRRPTNCCGSGLGVLQCGQVRTASRRSGDSGASEDDSVVLEPTSVRLIEPSSPAKSESAELRGPLDRNEVVGANSFNLRWIRTQTARSARDYHQSIRV